MVIWSLVHFLRTVGAVLDALGVIMIAVVVIQMERSSLSAKTLEELELELNKERDSESSWSIAGVILIFIGFVLILVAEIVSWHNFSSAAVKRRAKTSRSLY